MCIADVLIIYFHVLSVLSEAGKSLLHHACFFFCSGSIKLFVTVQSRSRGTSISILFFALWDLIVGSPCV